MFYFISGILQKNVKKEEFRLSVHMYSRRKSAGNRRTKKNYMSKVPI